jgi:preprotein translocase subunit SecA
MKSTNQIHRISAIKRTEKQAKKPQLKCVTIVFYDRKNGKEMFSAELPEAIYSAVVRVCQKRKIGCGRFFEQACRAFVQKNREVAS